MERLEATPRRAQDGVGAGQARGSGADRSGAEAGRAWAKPKPDADGVVRTRTGWRKLLPDILGGRGQDEA